MTLNVVNTDLKDNLTKVLSKKIINLSFDENAQDMLTLEVAPSEIKSVSKILRDDQSLDFSILIDLCGVDYLQYGISEWETSQATFRGYERGVRKIYPSAQYRYDKAAINRELIPDNLNQPTSDDVVDEKYNNKTWDKPRFAVVYHLLSIAKNHRLRVKVFLADHDLAIDSVCPVWNNANWYEREAFDLFGILFKDHPDLRRLLTDYGFIGYPFRKDFPLIGDVACRYDAKSGRVIYEPVDIEPRTLVPKVIRNPESMRKDESKSETKEQKVQS